MLLGDYERSARATSARPPASCSRFRSAKACSAACVNTLGQPVDGKGEIERRRTYPIEKIAPGIITRQSVSEPVQTGIKAIDAMIPIGRGQRELIIGDRSDRQDRDRHRHHHSTSSRRREDADHAVYCIYVAIGQKQSTVARIVETLEDAGAMDYTIVVAASASDSGADAVHRPLRRLRDGRVLHGQRQGRADRLRRPVQARGRLPPDVAAAAPPAGPRGLPRRRLLPAQPPARARGALSDELAAARSPRCRSSRPRPATSRPTSRPT